MPTTPGEPVFQSLSDALHHLRISSLQADLFYPHKATLDVSKLRESQSDIVALLNLPDVKPIFSTELPLKDSIKRTFALSNKEIGSKMLHTIISPICLVSIP